jgi:3',5'-cyclic AMP phosphodiesterase CpdA
MPSTQDLKRATRQLHIIHLSDAHFGKNAHRFDPPPTPAGDTPKRDGYPQLLQKLVEDLSGPDPGCPVIICITGDLATAATYGEFQEAEEFIRGLASAPILGKSRGMESIFLTPGNHDVEYNGPDVGQRWQRYVELYNRLYGTSIKREDPWALVKLFDRTNETGAVILCLNSSIHVQRGAPDEERGHIDMKQLAAIDSSLKGLAAQDKEASIRVALVHHHPVLIPPLAEPGRGYDAVHNSGKLLTILRRNGFHIVLHGHKHIPCNFTDDTQSPFWQQQRPLLIVAGGSVGSTGLPDYPNRCNCYNRITVKWHPAAGQTRIVVETRGLTIFETGGTEALPNAWQWKTLRYDDRQFFNGQKMPRKKKLVKEKFGTAAHLKSETLREEVYKHARGNMPVVEVVPSLIPGQAYEARIWIVGHKSRTEADIPLKVTWSAGGWFTTIVVKKEDDIHFCAAFNYWGSFLIQGKLEFADGTSACVHVYARMPEDYSD